MTEPKMTLPLKLAAVMEATGRVPKRGYNKAQDYWYVREEDLVEEARNALIEQKILLLPSHDSDEVRETQRVDKSTGQVTPGMPVTKVRVTYRFIDAESGDELLVPMIGEGADPGDKGSSKALTGALKYVLRQSFLIPTGDDPEKDEGTDAGRDEGVASPPASASGNGQRDERPISSGKGSQNARLYGIAMQHNDSDQARARDAISRACQDIAGITDSRQLPRWAYEDVVAVLEGTKTVERQADIPADMEGLPEPGAQEALVPAGAEPDPDPDESIPF